jgi:hypothetical protein
MPDGFGGTEASRAYVRATLRPGRWQFALPSDLSGFEFDGPATHMRELALRILRITGVTEAQAIFLEEVLRRSRTSGAPPYTLPDPPALQQNTAVSRNSP